MHKIFELKAGIPGSDWTAVSEADWIKAERSAGFRPRLHPTDPAYDSTCATGGWGGSGSAIQGRIRYSNVQQDEATRTMHLNDHDATALRGALELARDQYRKIAGEMRTQPAHERLAEQFDRQAADADRLIEQLDA